MKQQCLSEDFIAINDKRKRLPWVFMCNKERGKELTNREPERERVCVRGRASEEREVALVQRSTY